MELLNVPNFSILIEWENLRIAELWRAKRMLQEVAKQIREVSENLSLHPEIIILYNEEVPKDYKIEQFVREALGSYISLIVLKIISTPNLSYYEQRNFGVKYCSNEILIFLDCDVIPDEGWLTALLAPFKDEEISVVSGLPYVSPTNMYHKALALFWIFPPKDDPDYRTSLLPEFVPDNVAIRREVFLKNKFPHSDTYRGAIVDHCNLIKAKGYKIFRQPKATVSHPTPIGLKNVAIRSLCEGHDKFFAWRGSHDRFLNNSSRKKHSIIRFIKQQFSVYRERCKFVDLSLKDKIGVFCIGSVWFGFMLFGFLLTAINPRLINSRIKI